MPNLKSGLRGFRGGPPDAGWSWVVLAGAFLNIACLDGLVYSFGIYLPSIMDHYQSSKGTTSWASSVLAGLLEILGPLAAILSKKFGCRAVSITGGVILAAGTMLSTFSPNVNVFVIVYGVVGGLGIGLLYLPCILMIGVYFNKRRAMAVGIASCGTGFGVFMFPLMADVLMKQYNWMGALWVTSGVLLNCAVFSSVFRPFKQAKSKEECIEADYIPGLKSKKLESKATLLIKPEHDSKELVNLSQSFLYIDGSSVTSITESETVRETSASLEKRNISTVMHANDFIFSSEVRVNPHSFEEAVDIEESHRVHSSLHYHSHTSVIDDALGTKQHILGERSLQLHHQDGTLPTPKSINERVGSCLSAFCDRRVLRNPVNVFFGAINFIFAFGFSTPVVFLPTLALQLHIPSKESAFLLSIVGLSGMVGRFSMGYVADKPWSDAFCILSSVYTIVGIATVLMPLYTNFAWLASYSIVYGFCTGAVVCLIPIVCVDIGGLDNLAAVYGFILLCTGISRISGVPIMGMIADYTGSFDASFYFTGSLFLTCGLMTYALRRLIIRKQKYDVK